MAIWDYVAVAFFVALIAFSQVLTARYRLYVIPWRKVKDNKEIFGGQRFITQCYKEIAIWILVSIVSTLPILICVKLLEQVANSAGSTILVINITVSILFYLILVQETKNILEEQKNNEKILLADSANKKSFGKLISTGNFNPHLFFKLLLSIIPTFMAKFYLPFLKKADIFLEGGVKLLLREFKANEIVNGYQQAIDTNKYCMKIKETVDELNEKGIESQAKYILTEKIKRLGYEDSRAEIMIHATSQMPVKPKTTIKTFLANIVIKTKTKLTTNQIPTFIESRQSERTKFNNSHQVDINYKRENCYGSLVDASNNGSGCYISTDEDIPHGESINITLNEKSILGNVVHKNNFEQRSNTGMGIRINEGQNHIASLIPT